MHLLSQAARTAASPRPSHRPRPGWPAGLLALAWLAAAGAAHGAHGAHGAHAAPPAPEWALTAAVSDRNGVRKLGLLVRWPRPAPGKPLWQGRRWQLTLRHELELAAWHVPQARRITELGYAPVFVLAAPDERGVFLEGAIGVRLLSHTRLSPDRSMRTAFQFSDMLGLGLRWGKKERGASLGLRLQHLSNLGIRRPNPGINFLQLYYRQRF